MKKPKTKHTFNKPLQLLTTFFTNVILITLIWSRDGKDELPITYIPVQEGHNVGM